MPSSGEPEQPPAWRPRTPSVEYTQAGSYLRDLRVKAGLEQGDLCEKLTEAGLNPPVAIDYMINLENGEISRPPHPDLLPALERAVQAPEGALHHAYGYLAPPERVPMGTPEYRRAQDALELVAALEAGDTTDPMLERQGYHLLLACHPWLDNPNHDIGGMFRTFAATFCTTHKDFTPESWPPKVSFYEMALAHLRSEPCAECAGFRRVFMRRYISRGESIDLLPDWIKNGNE